MMKIYVRRRLLCVIYILLYDNILTFIFQHYILTFIFEYFLLKLQHPKDSHLQQKQESVICKQMDSLDARLSCRWPVAAS